MKRIDSPKKQPVPFGINGQRENLLPSTPAGDNTASYSDGFPAVTMILKAAGGLPPKGQDMNQILFELSSLARWTSTGAVNAFDADFATSVGGYPKGAILLGDDGTTLFISTNESNLNNPSTGGAGWFNLSTGYLRTENNLSDVPDKVTARTNLGLSAFISYPSSDPGNFSQVNSPDGKQYIFIANNGSWGAQSDTGTPIALGVGSGGTGATTAAAARANLGLKGAATEDVVPISKGGTGASNAGAAKLNFNLSGFLSSESTQAGDFNQMFSPDQKFSFVVANGGAWGLQKISDGSIIALAVDRGGTGATKAADARKNLGLGNAATENIVPVEKGGTGATDASNARKNLNLAGFLSRDSNGASDSNQMFSPNQSRSIVMANNGDWGAQLNDGTVIALPVGRGGTGSTTPAGARTSLGIGAVAVEDVLSVAKGGTAGTTAAQARNNLGLGNAATFTVGTGANQIPDMNSFTKGAGWQKLPSGKILQWFLATTNTSGAVQVNYPMAFPNAVNAVYASPIDVNNPGFAAANVFNLSACLVSAYGPDSTRVTTNVYIFAIGE